MVSVQCQEIWEKCSREKKGEKKEEEENGVKERKKNNERKIEKPNEKKKLTWIGSESPDSKTDSAFIWNPVLIKWAAGEETNSNNISLPDAIIDVDNRPLSQTIGMERQKKIYTIDIIDT